MSVLLVQPPHVHQQRLEFAADSTFAEHPPGWVALKSGMGMFESMTAWIHSWTSGELVSGTLSRGGYLEGSNVETGEVKKKVRKVILFPLKHECTKDLLSGIPGALGIPGGFEPGEWVGTAMVGAEGTVVPMD
jgi:hypothetical protein